MDIYSNWFRIKALFRESFKSSLHYAIATVDADGSPHVTPIGSLMLREPGRAIYFEKFTRHMPQNFLASPQVCVLAVRSGLFFWLKSLLRGRFDSPPAIRLHGTVGEPRDATTEEIALWQRRVRRMRYTKGYRMMWADMCKVRDITFTRAEGVHIGAMTASAWTSFSH